MDIEIFYKLRTFTQVSLKCTKDLKKYHMLLSSLSILKPRNTNKKSDVKKLKLYTKL